MKRENVSLQMRETVVNPAAKKNSSGVTTENILNQ